MGRRGITSSLAWEVSLNSTDIFFPFPFEPHGNPETRLVCKCEASAVCEWTWDVHRLLWRYPNPGGSSVSSSRREIENGV